jgi:hypothetical protein
LRTLRLGSIDESLKGGERSSIGIGSAQKSMRRVMPQVNSGQLPHELIDIEITPQMSKIDGALNELGQKAAPGAFHFQDLVPDPALDIIKLEQPSRDRTSSWQPGPLRPSEPIADQRPHARKTFARRHRRLDNMDRGELRHMRQQFYLDVLFAAEVREQSAFRHSYLIGKDAERDAAQA